MELLVYDETIWTYQEYCQLPDNGQRYQVIQGVLYVVPAPTYDHQKSSRNLEFLIWKYVKENGLGEVLDAPVDVIFSPTDVVQPDLAFVSRDKLDILQQKGICGTPDLIVEIISPSTQSIDEKFKKGLYEKYGVREYLLVYPTDKKVVQYLIEGGHYVCKGTYPAGDVLSLYTIPLRIEVKEIF